MARKRDTGGVRRRGRIWWVWFYSKGERYDESTGQADERAARAVLAQRRRELRDGTFRAGGAPRTLREYLEGWLARREGGGVRNIRNERLFLLSFVIPVIGELRLVQVTRVHVRDTIQRMRRTTSERTGTPYSSRMVLHVYRTFSTAMQDAVLDGLIPATPCTLRTRKGELPAKRDKDPQWRSQAVYTRDETECVLSDARIPLERRVYYAMMLLGGLRSGEAVGRRWRDYDSHTKPLGRLVVATQADGAGGDKETKTGEVREVPVHPTLAALLAEWRLGGFALVFGRHPKPDDPIVPSRGDPTGRSFRSPTSCYERLRDRRPSFAVECKTGDRAIGASVRYFAERTPIPRFYQVHRGERRYESGKVTVLPFTAFCTELEMP